MVVFSYRTVVVGLLVALPRLAVAWAPVPHPLDELVREGAPSLYRVYNPARVSTLVVDERGQVSCVAGAEPPPTVDLPEQACRDPRIALVYPDDQVRHYFQDAVHQVGGPLIGGTVVLRVAETDVRTWDVGAAVLPRGCGKEGIVRSPVTLTLDIGCRGDVAVVRWVRWHGFLTRECDTVERGTRAIGPDLRCTMGGSDPHAQVLDGGIDRIDLNSGEAAPVRD